MLLSDCVSWASGVVPSFPNMALPSFRTSSFRVTPCQQQRGMAVTMAARERTFIMIKPDAVQRGLVGDIIKRFEQKGFKLCGLKFKQAGLAPERVFIAVNTWC